MTDAKDIADELEAAIARPTDKQIAPEWTIVLDEVQWDMLQQTLDNPPEPNEALKKLFAPADPPDQIGDAPERPPWPDPTDEMLVDPRFEAIWQAIKSWDINVPSVYGGYCGSTGNHVRAIFDALAALRSPADGYRAGAEAMREACAQIADECTPASEWAAVIAATIRARPVP